MTAAPPAAAPAAGSSFYTAMRILPKPRREAMYAIYRFCRAVDDIADGEAPQAERLTELGGWRARIAHLYAGDGPSDWADLGEAVRRFGLRREDFEAVIDGMAMDAETDIQAPDAATLDRYCDRVASAVGRLSVRVFGIADEEPGRALAHHLGRALQLTNILRDLDEDAARNRLYLPREALAAAGIAETAPAAVLSHPRLPAACGSVAAAAERHFDDADRIMSGCPRASVRAPRLMSAAYRAILGKLLARGWAPPRAAVKVRKLRLLGALLRHGLI